MLKLNKKIGQDILIAKENILKGNIVVFPTETVYGIGADATNKEAVNKIYEAKKRPSDNPLIVHICNLEMLNKVVENVNEIEKKLIKEFWPGPLSIIFPKKECIPDNVTANLDTVAVRMPDNEIALELIKKCNLPIAAPSANISSKPSGTCIEDIYEELNDSVSYFLDGGNSKVGIESTVVKVIDNVVHILRPGKITKEDILKITDKVIIDKKCFEKLNHDEEVISPGMKHKHYAPSIECILIKGNNENVIKKINELIKSSENKLCVMVTNYNIDKIIKNDNVEIINLGNNLEEVSKNLFSSLRKLDKIKANLCFVQSFDLEGQGLGIMNRLIRACNHNIIDV